jgi:hypothetical protein
VAQRFNVAIKDPAPKISRGAATKNSPAVHCRVNTSKIGTKSQKDDRKIRLERARLKPRR